jgi:hypothetical protein
MTESNKSILANVDAQVAKSLEPLAADDRAVVAASGDNAGVRVGAAVDLGKGFAAGGHVEKVKGTKSAGSLASRSDGRSNAAQLPVLSDQHPAGAVAPRLVVL